VSQRGFRRILFDPNAAAGETPLSQALQ